MKAKLHAHQREALAKMHNGCVLWGDVGTGKTITSLGYALEKEPYRKIVIVTTAKVRDSWAWEKEAAKLLIPVDNIEVTSWNKINELVDYEGKFFIFDEQRLVGAGAWVKAFYKIAKKNHWILLSATPGDTWSDYAPMFIANGWYKNITEFRREHAIYSRFTQYPKIERWVNEGRLVKYRKRLLVEMPMARHTTKHYHYIECEFDADTLDTVRKKRWNVYEDKPLANAAELYGVMRKVVSSDPDRRSKMKKLVETHPRLIVFYNFNYELEILRGICQEISEERSSSMLSMTSTISELTKKPYVTTNSGLVIPASSGTQSTESSDLPPWDMSPEELASGQLVTTRRISSEEASKTWTESTESTTSSATTQSENPSPSTSSMLSPQPPITTQLILPSDRTSHSSTTPSEIGDRQLETTASSDENSSRTTPASTREIHPSLTTESQPPVKLPMTKTKSRHAGVRPGRIPSSSERLISRRPPSPAPTSSPRTSSPSSTDPWAGTIWEEGWEPPTGTPDPRKKFRSTRAKYDFEAGERKKEWMQTSYPSSTLTTSHQSHPEPNVPSLNSEDSGTTKTSTRPSSTTSEQDESCNLTKSTSEKIYPDTGTSSSKIKSGGSFGWAEWNGHKHQPIPDTDEWVYLVQYASGSEGWNCIETDQMAFWSLTYSWKQYNQAQGRIDRLNTPYSDLHYHILLTDSVAEKPVMKSLNQKHDFQPKM